METFQIMRPANPEVETVLRKLETYDMSKITQRLERKGVEYASNLEKEFRVMAAMWEIDRKNRTSPTMRVDQYWHEFILDTKEYDAFCNDVFGRFVHHVPIDDVEGDEFHNSGKLGNCSDDGGCYPN